MANKRTIVSAGHGIGKTGLAAAAIHWFASTRPRFAIVATANTEDQLKKKLWRELAKINDGAKNKDWFKWDTSTFTRFGDPTTQAVALPNNENNPGAFAGTHEDHVLGVFDEAAEIPRNIWNVFNGAMTTAGSRWLAISNPPFEGYFFDAAFGKLKARKPGDGRRLWTSFTVPSFDSPFVDPEYVETMREQLGEQSDDFQVQVLGLPPRKSVQQFLSPELIIERDGAHRPAVQAVAADHRLRCRPRRSLRHGAAPRPQGPAGHHRSCTASAPPTSRAGSRRRSNITGRSMASTRMSSSRSWGWASAPSRRSRTCATRTMCGA
jgi:hypothetical protein